MEDNCRQACSPLIQLFFGFASDIYQTNINRDIKDGNWLSSGWGQFRLHMLPIVSPCNINPFRGMSDIDVSRVF